MEDWIVFKHTGDHPKIIPSNRIHQRKNYCIAWEAHTYVLGIISYSV